MALRAIHPFSFAGKFSMLIKVAGWHPCSMFWSTLAFGSTSQTNLSRRHWWRIDDGPCLNSSKINCLSFPDFSFG